MYTKKFSHLNLFFLNSTYFFQATKDNHVKFLSIYNLSATIAERRLTNLHKNTYNFLYFALINVDFKNISYICLNNYE